MKKVKQPNTSAPLSPVSVQDPRSPNGMEEIRICEMGF